MTELKTLKELDFRDARDAAKVLTMLFEGKDHAEIGEALGIARVNATLKIHRLMDTREFQNALTDEWVKQYRQMKIDNPKEAFKQLTRLVTQTITRHFENTQDITLTERRELVIVSAREYETAINAEVERALQTVNPRKQMDTAQTPSEASSIPPS